MRILKAYRYKLEPTKEQLERIRQWGGCTRYVYNRLLAEREGAWKRLGQAPTKEAKSAFNKEWSYNGMSAKVTRWRRELEWLAEAPFHATQNAARQLADAHKNWWAGRGKRPAFKKKSSGADSWRETDPAQIDVNGRAVKLPKFGWIKARISRPFRGALRQATVRQEGDQWHVSLLSEETVGGPRPNGGGPIGLDMGVANVVTDSEGVHHDVLPETAEERARLARRARAVSRTKKGSKNRKKAQGRLNRARRRVRRRVHDRIHKLTTALAKNHGLVAVEDLRIRSMTASAKGNQDEPGRNVAMKSGLNREILSCSWGEIRRQLEYKCAWHGSRLVAVPAAYSSQECSECGRVDAENRPTRDVFRCLACGHESDADMNAARVVLKRGLSMAAGHAVTACGEDVRPRVGRRTSVKQEPTRGAQRCAV